nr:unnamed protein product [Digitaria exilis]
MGKGDVATRSKSQKSSAMQNEQSTPTNPPTAYPDWSQFQAYYNTAGTAPVTPPAFFHSSVAPSPQGHPYMWGPQGSRAKDSSERGQGNDSRNKGTQNSAAEPQQPSSGPVVLNPMMPFWHVPPPMGGPAMDYWGAPTSVPMHGKVAATPTSAPSSNSRDIVLSDPAIQDERELKKQKRKQSNRESARRSRLRKQAEWEEVANRADLLKQENSSLKEELKQLQEKCDSLTSENTSLHEKLKALEDEKSNGNCCED